MNDLYGKQLTQKRELTERKQLFTAYFSRYHQNDPILLYHLFETSVSMRNANVHIDKLITSFSLERISFRNISHSRNLSHDNFRCPPFHSKTCLMDLCDFLILF